MSENHCGGCTMCCNVLGITELKKPGGVWCVHCAIGQGCKVYDIRPQSCHDYACVWLTSHTTSNGGRWPIEMRPDHNHVVMTLNPDGQTISIHPQNGYWDAWRNSLTIQVIEHMLRAGMRVIVNTPDIRVKQLLKLGGPGIVLNKTITMSEPDAKGMQWYDPGRH